MPDRSPVEQAVGIALGYVETKCDAERLVNRLLPIFTQQDKPTVPVEGDGGLEGWPPVWLVRLDGHLPKGLPILDPEEAASWERTEGTNVRRYLPVPPQQSTTGKIYCPKCGSRNCRHGLPLVTFTRLQEIHNGTGKGDCER